MSTVSLRSISTTNLCVYTISILHTRIQENQPFLYAFSLVEKDRTSSKYLDRQTTLSQRVSGKSRSTTHPLIYSFTHSLNHSPLPPDYASRSETIHFQCLSSPIRPSLYLKTVCERCDVTGKDRYGSAHGAPCPFSPTHNSQLLQRRTTPNNPPKQRKAPRKS